MDDFSFSSPAKGQTTQTTPPHYVGTDLTGKLSEHIYAPDKGPKVPS